MVTEGILDTGYYTEATETHTLTIAGIRDVPVCMERDCDVTSLAEHRVKSLQQNGQ